MIIAVCSWRGTGSTTTALLLASTLAAGDERGSWLIEADPAGGAIAGRMQLASETVGGLERVAFPPERITPLDAFESVKHTHERLRIVSAPSDPFRAHACHQPRLPWAASLRELSGHVVIDVGRLRGGTPSWPVLAIADAVLLVSSPEVSAAVSTSEWLRANGRVSPADPGLADDNTRVVFVNSPGGVPFARSTLTMELDGQFAAWLPWEPAAVDLIHRGATPTDRRLRRSALIAATYALAVETLSEARVEA